MQTLYAGFLYLLLALPFVVSLSYDKYEDQSWGDSFIINAPCEEGKEHKGQWCQWQEWGPCEVTTCTRTRRRRCACPEPFDWTRDACDAVLPQDDMVHKGKIEKHTRRVRRARWGGNCQIPFFVGETYQGDCVKQPFHVSGYKYYKHVCDGGRDCIVNDYNDPMEEKDVGACDGWPVVYDWIQSGIAPSERTIFTTNSKLGKKCYNPKIHESKDPLLAECKEKLFYNAAGQRNVYSNLNNLAHVIENCRFACAIDQQCLGIEFVKGAFCNLISKYRADKVIRQLGTLTERKPRACYAAQYKEFNYTYPYRKAVNHLKKQGKD